MTNSAEEASIPQVVPTYCNFLLTGLGYVKISRGLGEEILSVIFLSIPLAGAFLLFFLLQLISIAFVGHLGQLELAGAAIGMMFATVTGFTPGIGLLTAIDTQSSQLVGSNQFYSAGVVSQRGAIISLAMSVPIMIIWWFSSSLLILIGIHHETSELAGLFIRILIPCLYPYYFFEVLKRYLQTQSIVKPALVVAACGIVIGTILSYLLVYQFDLGFIGSPIAFCITYICMPVTLLLYIILSKTYKKTWNGFNIREIFELKQLGEFLKLGISGIVMTCAEWWSFEFLTLMSGWLPGNVPLDAQALIINVLNCVYMYTLGTSVVASVRVGQWIGANSVPNAKRAALVSHVVGFVGAVIIGILLFVLRYQIPYIFTSDHEVAEMASHTIFIMCIFMGGDSIQGISAGILRGMGKQIIGAICYLISFYMVGLVIAYLLCFKAHLGILGLWYGQLTGSLVLAIMFLVYIWLIASWTQAAENKENSVEEGETEPLLPDDSISEKYSGWKEIDLK